MELSRKNQMLVEEMNNCLDGLTMDDIKKLNKGKFHFPVYINDSMEQIDITDLDISVRSFNCLRRNNINNLRELVERTDREEDLLKFRNLGAKSAKEIMFSIFAYQFSVLEPARRKTYMEQVLSVNGISKKAD